MSAKFDLTKHKALWNWLAEDPKRCKSQWPGWGEILIEGYCYACKYDSEIAEEENASMEENDCADCCDYCPLIWPNNEICSNKNSIFRKWYDNNTTKEEQVAIAHQIANLPIREGVETI